MGGGAAMEGQPPPTYVQPGAAVPSVVGAVVPEGGGKAQGGAVASAPPPAYAPVVQATVLQAGYGGDQFGLNPAAVPQQPQVAQVVQAESWQNAISVSPARPPAGVCAKESFKICVAAVVGAVLCGIVVFLAMGGGDDLVDGGPREPTRRQTRSRCSRRCCTSKAWARTASAHARCSCAA